MAFIDTVKAWFNSGDEPTQAQFFQKFAWLRWKDEKVPTADVDGLNDLLIAKADKVPFDVHLADAIKHITPQERAAWNGDIPISRITDLQAFISSVNTLLASDDVTLDELQEIVTYIKQNKSDLQNLAVPNIAGLEDALASKITKNETGDENKFFNEKGVAVEIPPQLQADFNQTDDTQPDYIKGGVAVLDHNGAKKFDAKEIQFDVNFEFNPAENEVSLVTDKFKKVKKLFNPFTSISGTIRENDINISYSNVLTKPFDSLFFDENTLYKWCKFQLLSMDQIYNGLSSNDPGTISPKEIKVELFLEIMSNHSFKGNINEIKVAEKIITDKNLIEIKTSNAFSFYDFSLVAKKESFSTWTSDVIFLKWFKKMNNTVTYEQSYFELRHDNHPNGDVFTNLSDVDFRIKMKRTITFDDATNSAGNNIGYVFNSSLEESFIDIN